MLFDEHINVDVLPGAAVDALGLNRPVRVEQEALRNIPDCRPPHFR